MKKKTLIIALIISLVILIILPLLALVPYKIYKTGEGKITDTELSMGIDKGYVDSYLPEMPTLGRDELVNNQEGSKIQKNGSISFLVTKIDDSVDSVKAVNQKYSAEITNIYDYGRGNDRVVQITVKVPVTEFEKFYEDLRKLDGEVTYANISTTDVTEQYIDITSRLTNLKSVESQLVEILEKADTVTDILAVQRELNTVRGEIESYEQRKRYFDTQTDYSYISLTFSIDKTGLNITDEEWKPLGEFRAALNALISLLKGFVNATIWVLVFSPIVLIPIGIVLVVTKRKKPKSK